MSNIKVPKKQFEKEIGKLDKTMQEKIALFGTPLESFNEEEIEIEIFPNRPDLLSYQGFKRSFLAFLGKKTGLKKYKIHKPEKNYKVKIDKSVKDVRPYTACTIVKNLKFNDEKIKEIIDIQEKIHTTVGRKRKKVAIGIYPLEEIKLPITFKALEPDKIKFQPLEYPKELSGLQILQRHPTGRDYAHLLAGKARFPIFIDANNEILSMPPIINSQKTGRITEKTKEIFIECSGSDFETLKKTLDIIVTTLAEMGGKIYQMEVTGLPNKEKLLPNLNSEINKISLEKTNKLLGTEITQKELKKLLERMGHEYNEKTNEVESPSWRTDILHEVDLIEDVAIAYGYENFKPEIPEVATIGQENKKETTKIKIAEILSGINMLETSSYLLTREKNQYENMGEQTPKENEILQLQDSKTDYTLLRKDLSHYLLRILSENIDAEYPQRIFQTGRVFDFDSNKKEINEKENFSAALTPGNFTEMKQILNYLARNLDLEINVEKPDEKTSIPKFLIEGRVGEIKLKDKTIGFIGEVHPKILKNWKIKMPVALLEISLEEIFEELSKK